MAEYYGDHFEITEEGCDEFRMAEDNEDSFRMWQGLVGPYYTPYVSPDGTLSFTNNGSLPNPEPVNVRGPQGAGIRIAGIVSSEEDLPASAAEGDIWLVGESIPYEGYSLNAGQWIDLGPLTIGPAGPPGPQGEPGEQGPAGQDGADGVSPEVTVESITGGHTVTITDADHPSGQSFDVMDGQDGEQGPAGQDGADGVSPEVTVESITGGHTVTITDADHPSGQSFDVMDGQDGAQGPAGPGVPSGGSAGQFYRKASSTDYDGEWHTLSAGDSSYDSSLTYSSGTVGKELGDQKNTLNQLEAETETVENGLAIIVEGNSCASGASQGQYVYLKDSTITGYADGLYTAAQAIPANTAIDGTYLAAVTGGGLNSLKNSIANLGSTRGTLSAQTSRGSLTAGDAFEFGKLLLINVKFTASVTAANSPHVITVVDVNPAYDSALSCIDITSGISNAIDASQPCGISTTGRIYIKEITANHVYAITGIVKCS